MLIAIPIAASDKNHLGAFVKSLQQFPPAPGDRALIVATPDVMFDREAADAMNAIRAIFGPRMCAIQQTPNVPQGGWPRAANHHFMWMCDAIQNMEQREGSIEWMWCETDVRFIRSRWSEILQTAKRNAGSPFMGVEVESRMEMRDKTNGQISVQSEGVHMMGVGLYPGRYTVGRTGWKFPQDIRSFTIWCQHEHTPFTRTSLIEHRARTVNWRYEDGKFLCDDAPGKSPNAIKYAGVVDLSRCVLVHGDKDGSLQKLIADNPRLVPELVTSATETPPPPPPTQQIEESKPVVVNTDKQSAESSEVIDFIKSLKEELKAEQATNAVLRQSMMALQERMSQLGSPASVVQSTEPPFVAPPVDESTEAQLPTYEHVKNAIKAGNTTLQEVSDFLSFQDLSALGPHIASLGFNLSPPPQAPPVSTAQLQPKAQPVPEPVTTEPTPTPKPAVKTTAKKAAKKAAARPRARVV